MKQVDDVDFASVYNKSLDLISRREHSTFELIQKLKKRYGSIVILDEVILKLQDLKLLDDHRFAEAYIKARSRKGFGPIRIEAELRQRRVNESVITSELRNIEDWHLLASTAFKKKFSNFQKDTQLILKAKSFLQNRGFSYEQIEFCLQEA